MQSTPHKEQGWEEKLGDVLHIFITPSNCTCCEKMGMGHSMAHLNTENIKSFIQQEIDAAYERAATEVEGMKESDTRPCERCGGTGGEGACPDCNGYGGIQDQGASIYNTALSQAAEKN